MPKVVSLGFDPAMDGSPTVVLDDGRVYLFNRTKGEWQESFIVSSLFDQLEEEGYLDS